nr:hypothetical protein [uncultured Amphritea sp.]
MNITDVSKTISGAIRKAHRHPTSVYKAQKQTTSTDDSGGE